MASLASCHHLLHSLLLVSWSHLLHSLLLVSWLVVFLLAAPSSPCDPWTTHGPVLTLVVTGLRLLGLLGVPQVLCNLLGLLGLDTFPGPVRTRGGDGPATLRLCQGRHQVRLQHMAPS